MRLYLAVAVLVLALVAYTEAQDATMEEKMTQFGDQNIRHAHTHKHTNTQTHNKNHKLTVLIYSLLRKWFNEQMEKVKKNLQ
uniref:Apolipoprotein C-I-like n=1 Tax=Gouania willdenowi TaxID=441366 RepID=A0A8C5ELV8_GOUWI